RMLRRFHEAGIAADAVGVDLRGQRGIGRQAASKATPDQEPAPKKVSIYHAVAHDGLVFPMARGEQPSLLFLTETDVTGNRAEAAATGKRNPAKRRDRVDPLAMDPGDLVVHDSHGIGMSVKMTAPTACK